MSQTPQPGPQDPGKNEPATQRNEALFGHLFSSRPQRQRRLVPWLIGALLHIPIMYLFLTSSLGERVLERAEIIIRPILTIDDNPPAIARPPEVELPRLQPPVANREIRPREPARVAPPLPTPGEPDPGALVTPRGIPSEIPTNSGRPGTLLDRLAAPPRDGRLFAPVDPSGLLTGPEAARARLADRIGRFNDSIAAERLAAERSMDWTVKGEDGKRWGVSPGKIHLGDITLPLPLAFSTPPGRRDEANARTRSFAEIEEQAGRAELKDNFRDRVKEIRKRKDRERAAGVADKPPAPADKKKGGVD